MLVPGSAIEAVVDLSTVIELTMLSKDVIENERLFTIYHCLNPKAVAFATISNFAVVRSEDYADYAKAYGAIPGIPGHLLRGIGYVVIGRYSPHIESYISVNLKHLSPQLSKPSKVRSCF